MYKCVSSVRGDIASLSLNGSTSRELREENMCVSFVVHKTQQEDNEEKDDWAVQARPTNQT